MMFVFVPQRSAAKAAETKLKGTNGKSSERPSSARSCASQSPSTAGGSPEPSTPSGSGRTSIPRKKAPANKTKSRSLASDPDSDLSLFELSDQEDEEDQVLTFQSLPMISPSAASSSSPEHRRSQTEKRANQRSIDSDPYSTDADGFAAVDAVTASTPLRSKRSAAQAAQNNIQRAYSEHVLDELAAPARKKSRSATSSLSSPTNRTAKSTRPSVPSRSKYDRDEGDGYRASSSAASTKSRAKSSSGSHPAKGGRRFQDDQGSIWELQSERCSAARYRHYRRCVHCIAKQAGDTCRFVDFRAFPVDPDTDELRSCDASNTPSPAFIASPDSDEVMQLPAARPLASDSLLEAQANVAKSLLPVLDAELQHAKQTNVLRRPRETTCRQMCEFCATSIFSASWFCRRCGREYCPDCKDAIEHPDNSDVALAKRLAICDRSRSHAVADLVPLTRFDVALLDQEVVAMRGMLADDKAQAGTGSMHHPDAATTDASCTQSDPSDDMDSSIRWREVPRDQAGLTADRVIGSLPLRVFDSASFNTNVFRREWAHGEPLLVRNVTPAMQHNWGPDELAARYGDESCLIMRSDTEPAEIEQVSVGEFFSTFGRDPSTKQEVLGKGSWKLKDWPPSAEFKHEFPELYDDFNRAVPAPEYTTREGVLNLGSCYPQGVIQPDLGPKMYNAWPASEGVGGQGTTRLHMDIADAVNIMLYAAPPTGDDVPEEHKPGVAAWDIFRAEDADTLRVFLREEHAKLNFKDDPIHIQRFFISAPQRVKLYRKYGVKSWRIYQKAGEAVFIPAGCAHQVCNLTDCVKVAVDFVSPQNVERCFKLTAEFRELVKDYKKAWKEDVLSLRTTLWYAWCTYREMDRKGPNVWAKEQSEVKREEGIAKISRKVLQDA